MGEIPMHILAIVTPLKAVQGMNAWGMFLAATEDAKPFCG